MANQNQNPGAGVFVPSTYVWDVARLHEVSVTSPEFKELLVRLYQNINNISLALNIKDTGLYNVIEVVNGQIFFPNPALNSSTPQTPAFRQVYRTVVDFGALPNAATKSVTHGIQITPTTTFTRIYATASNLTGDTYIPIPYASPTAANSIEISVDATNVNITTAIDYSAYTICYVILEYLQN
jgi:hypothetical protein